MHVLPHSMPQPYSRQATTDPRCHWRLLDTHRQVWVRLLWGHCSFLLGPGAQGSVCALQGSISQSCVSSGSSKVGLMVTSYKVAYGIPKYAALIIREMPIKTTVRYYLTPVRMAIIKKSTNYKRWRECGEKGALLHCWWDCKLIQPLWKTVRRFLKKNRNKTTI